MNDKLRKTAIAGFTATVGLGFGLVGPVGAQEYPGPQAPAPEVAGVEQERQPVGAAPGARVAGVQEERVAGAQQAQGATLPVTGGDVLGLAALGAGAIALGGAAMAARNRRATR
jgi:hypothetical protein